MHYTAAGSVVGQELDGCKNPYGQVRDNKFNIVFFIHDQPQCSKIFRGEEYNNEKSYYPKASAEGACILSKMGYCTVTDLPICRFADIPIYRFTDLPIY